MSRCPAAERPAPFRPYLAYSEKLDERCHGGDRGHDHGPELDGQPILQFPQIGLPLHNPRPSRYFGRDAPERDLYPTKSPA